MKTYIFLTIAILTSFINFRPILAATKTPTPSLPIAITLAPTKPEDEKLQEIRQTIKEISTQIKDKMEKRAYVGTIREIASETIIITNFRGQQRIITDEITVFIASNKKEIRIKDLAVGDKLIALGTSSDNDELQAIRIIVVAPTKNPPPARLVFIGKIVQTDTVKSTLSFANEGANAATKIYKIDRNSKYSPAYQEPLKTVNLKLLPINKRAVLVYQEINKVLTVKSLFSLE